MGEEGALFTYRNDSCLLAESVKLAEVMDQAPTIYGKVGLRIGLGPGKTELALPQDYERRNFPYPLDIHGIATPHVVQGFSSCLGVPRHSSNDSDFIITSAL